MWSRRFSKPLPLSNIHQLPDYAFQFVFSHLQGIRIPFILLTGCRVLGALLAFLTTYQLGEMITNVGTITIKEIYLWYLPVLLGIYVSKELLDYFTRKYSESLPSIYGDHLEQRFLATLSVVRTPELYNYSKEKLLTLIARYVGHCRKFISDWVWGITSFATSLTVTLTILFIQSPLVLAINVVYMIAYLTIAFRLSRKFSTLAAARSEAELHANALYQNSIFSLNFISRQRLENFILERLLERYRLSWKSIEGVQAFHAYRWLCQLNIFNTLYACTLCYGLYQVKSSEFSVGFLVLIKWSFDNLWSILVYMIEYYVQIVQQREDAKILRREMVSCLSTTGGVGEQKDFAPLKEQIEWKNTRVTFKRENETFSLAIPTCTIRRGQKVGIVGASGSGKSTLFATLYGSIPYTGEVLCDGKPIQDYTPRIASLTPQDVLLKLSLRDNLLLGRTVSPKLLDEVIKGCYLDEFCKDLDVMVGTASFNLSTGQEQRVRIARTLLQEADCVVLDEPFSGIDRATCDRIRDFLKSYLKDKTVLIASHVAGDIDWVDEVYEIKDGMLVKRSPGTL